MNGKSIMEIAVEIDESKLRELESFLQLNWIGYYIEPPRKIPYSSLEQVECDCEGK